MEHAGQLLIVDDEPLISRMISRELTRNGYEVVTCPSGTLALEEASRRSYDAAIVDLIMPGMDGIETLEGLKRVDPELEVLIATGSPSMETALACMNQGAYAYLRKPFDLAEARLTVAGAVQKRQLRGAVSLYEASRALLSTLGRPELGSNAAAAGRVLLRADAAVIVLDEPGGALRCHVNGSQEDEALARALGSAAARGGPEPWIAPLAGGSALICPLLGGRGSLGAVVAIRRSTGHTFTLLEARRAGIFAAQLALALDNAQLYAQIEARAVTDELTGLYSRRYFLETLRQRLNLFGRVQRGTLSCVLLDLDHFKRINDTWGHLEGDRVLVSVAQTLQRELRRADVAARLGGEEFVVLLPATGIDGALIVAEKLRKAVGARDAKIGITVSCGVAELNADELDLSRVEQVERAATNLLARADAALYAAKNQGRNCTRTDAGAPRERAAVGT